MTRVCPCCGGESSRVIDRKAVFTLEECENCRILFRFPYETETEMHRFYQNGYRQPPGWLTTNLPSDQELEELLKVSFKGTPKDFSRVLAILQALGVSVGARVLDFGASWGYASWQLRQAGYEVESYEIGQARAVFGARLGLKIHTELAELVPGFDAVYSGHVLEHTPNPLRTLQHHLSLVKPGGIVVAHTPNGSLRHRDSAYQTFHRTWGIAHPVLLNDQFVHHNFQHHPTFAAGGEHLEALGRWDRQSAFDHALEGPELLLVVGKCS